MGIATSFKTQFLIYRKHNLLKFTLAIIFIFLILVSFLIFYSESIPSSLSFLSLMRGYENCFNFSMSVTLSVNKILIFFIILIACTSISDEIQKGTLKIVLTKRIKREELVVSKYLFLMIFFFTLLFIIFMVSLILGAILFGISDITEKGYLLHSVNSLFLNSFLSIILMFLPLTALISLCLFLSVIF